MSVYPEKSPKYQGADISGNIEYGFSTDIPAEEQQGISRVLKEMYDSVGNNETTERTVKLTDYYEYYPLSVHFDLPGVWWSSYTYNDLEDYGYTAQKKVLDCFMEFFRIPVYEGDTVTLSVGKEVGGIAMGMEKIVIL